VTALLCPECTVDEDPAPWCDCQHDETCKGPCRQRAHDPERCPERSLLIQAINLWRCACGSLNVGRHGSFGLVNDNGHYDVCQGCGFEVYAANSTTGKRKAEAYYLALPVTQPWLPT